MAQHGGTKKVEEERVRARARERVLPVREEVLRELGARVAEHVVDVACPNGDGVPGRDDGEAD